MPHLHTDNTWVVYEWELVPRFWNSLNHLKVEIHRYRKRSDGIKKVQSGGNGRQMLIAFDSLRPDIKEAIGDPRKTDNPMERFYKVCPEASLFYATYAFEDGSTLTPGQQEEYTINASVLKAAQILKKERGALRGTQRGILPSVVNDVMQFNKVLENKYGTRHTLPASPKWMKKYMDELHAPFTYKGREYNYNYPSVLSGKLRNQNKAKILLGNTSADILQSLIEHGNQYDDRFIQIAYNKKAKELGLEPISVSAVRYWRSKLKHLVKPFREGWDEYRQEYSRAVKRDRPSRPGQLWESDDNHIDLLFNGDDNNPYHRFRGIFVQDSSHDLVLGYSCTEGELSPLNVRLAYINAMYYVRSLTGGWYLPFEVKTDRWRLAALRPFYQSLGHYYDTPVNSKNRGWQENFFGDIDWKRCLKTDVDGTPAINYTGNNITAKNAGFNRELSRINTKLFPHTDHAPAQIEAFVNRLRKIDLSGNGSREMKWLQAWSQLPESEKRPINDLEFMTLFGIKHEWQNSIEKSGIIATIMGQKISYAVPPAFYLPNVGKKVDVYYDPFNLSRVLVTDNERLRFMAHEMTPVPGTMRDMQLAGEGSRAFLNQIIEEKKADVNHIVTQRNERMKRLELAGIDIDYVLAQGGHVAKEISQAAEMAYISGGRMNEDDFDPADLM